MKMYGGGRRIYGIAGRNNLFIVIKAWTLHEWARLKTCIYY